MSKIKQTLCQNVNQRPLYTKMLSHLLTPRLRRCRFLLTRSHNFLKGRVWNMARPTKPGVANMEHEGQGTRSTTVSSIQNKENLLSKTSKHISQPRLQNHKISQNKGVTINKNVPHWPFILNISPIFTSQQLTSPKVLMVSGHLFPRCLNGMEGTSSANSSNSWFETKGKLC